MKTLNIFKQWWFWVITSILTAIFTKIVRDIAVQKRFINGVLGVDKYVKLYLKKQIDLGTPLGPYTTYDAVDTVVHPESMSQIITIVSYDNEAGVPSGIIEYYPYLSQVYQYMYDDNISFEEALQKVKDEYFLNKGIWVKI